MGAGRATTTVLGLGLLLGGRDSSAATFTWTIALEGCQEVPPTATEAQGSAVLTYNTDTNVLGYDISFSGLSSAELFSHIHGFATRGTEAGILYDLPTGSPKVGSVTLPEVQEPNLLAGQFYVNVHSASFPDGEIRGQIDALGACTDLIFADGFDPEPPTAFRITEMYVRDPHIYVNAFGCLDLTNGPTSFNGEINAQLQQDSDTDGDYDWSPVLVFRPLAPQTAATPVDLVLATCAFDNSGCADEGGTAYSLVANNQATGTCVGVIAGTTTAAYTPPVDTPVNQCFGTTAQTVALILPFSGGVPLTLYDARIGGVYQGAPATGIVRGLIRGFVSEADADNTVVPLPFGDTVLSRLLAGGTGSCYQPRPMVGDRDTGPGGQPGWYFYFNFSAVRTDFSN
jgi:hypothetical protein